MTTQRAEAVTGMSSALRAIEAREFLTTDKWQDQQWRAVRQGANPGIILFERVFLRRMGKLGVPMFAHNMVRTDAEQNALYVQGVTKARAGQSPHNFGMAVDLVHSLKAWEIPRESWTLIGHVGKEVAAQNGLRIVWGGDWQFYDPAHWELWNWETYKDAFPFV